MCGGFDADTGPTGRKLMVDTMAKSGSHGGVHAGKRLPESRPFGSLYAARHAKNIVAAEFAKQVSGVFGLCNRSSRAGYD